MTRLHFGRWRVPWLKAVWAVVGLVPAIMFVSGVVMWWNRVLRPKLRRSAVMELDPVAIRSLGDARAEAPALRVEM